ncbi:MAG: hypothetical protein ABIP19_02745 [Dermatophilaceae bacterium]
MIVTDGGRQSEIFLKWRRALASSTGLCDSVHMSMEMWWPTLLPETQDWLVAHNGEALPSSVIQEITQAAGSVTSDAWWVGQNGPTGFYLSDAAIDWIEEVANGEMPEAPE